MPLTVVSTAKNGMVPSLIKMKIFYHQTSKTTKKIIQASVSFENYIHATDEQYEGSQNFSYTLDFSFIPLTHTDLTIMFALDWQVYLLLYIGIGFVAIIIVGIFALYHTLMEK